jgi:L-fuconolactonase
VLNLASDYAGWLAACATLLDQLDAPAKHAIFGLNARRFYRID